MFEYKQQKLVSVIVPVYNCKKYLERCLESIKQQTYKNLEIILIDDGSKDNSGTICDQYAVIDERFKVIHQKNAGPGMARNAGLEIVSGDYLVYIDSDDYVSLNYIQTMIDFAEKYQAEIVELGSIWMLPMNNQMYGCDGTLTVFKGKEELVKDYFSGNRKLQNTLWGRLFKWDVIKDIRFTEKSIAEDTEYSLKALSNCNTLLKYNKCLYAYRAYQDSITRRKLSSKHFDVVDVMLRDMCYCESLGIEPESWDIVIRRFDKTVIDLLERIATEKQEENFQKELHQMKIVFNEVAQIAESHNVIVDLSLMDCIDNIVEWTKEYRRKNRMRMLIKESKAVIQKIFALYKTRVDYEYTFDESKEK